MKRYDEDMRLLLNFDSHILSPDETMVRAAQERLNQLTKPPGSLGKLEHMAVQLASITGQLNPSLERKAVVVMAADHGICEEQVSQYPQVVTGQMIVNFLNGGAAVNVLSRLHHADVYCCDIGSIPSIEDARLMGRKIRHGTANMLKEAAMSESEAVQAIFVGIECATELYKQGYRCFATGEMGIGNTTASSALLAAITGLPVQQLVGFGTGIDEPRRQHKIRVIEKALERYGSDNQIGNIGTPQAALRLLSELGGLDIAGLVGVILGAARHRCPVVIDGFIASVAAILAVIIAPSSRNYLIGSHLSEEPGHSYALEMLELTPVLNMQMRLGEGTGAVLCLPLLDAAIAILNQMATFASAGVSNDRESR